MVGQAQVTQLADRIEKDIDFASALEVDSLTTLRDSGFDELGDAVVRERDNVEALVDRIYRDEEFRQSVERAPRTVLDDWGIPEAAIESVLIVAGAPEEVVEQVTADVEAHGLGRKPLTFAATAAVLGAFAFAQEANATTHPATQAEVVSAQVVSAEAVSPEIVSAEIVSAEVVGAEIGAATAPEQVRAAIAPEVLSAALAKAQVSHAAWKWQGVNMKRLSAHHLASILHIQ